MIEVFDCMHTNIQDQSFSRGFWSVDTKRPHAGDDWTDEVNVEDGEEVDDVEDDGQGEEAHAPETRHSRWRVRVERSVVVWSWRVCAPAGCSKLSSRCFLNFAQQRCH